MERVELALTDALHSKEHSEEIEQLLKELKYLSGATVPSQENQELAPPTAILDRMLVPLANELLEVKKKLQTNQKENKSLLDRLGAVQRERDSHAEMNEKLVSEMEQVAKQAEGIKKALEQLKEQEKALQDQISCLEAAQDNILDRCLKQGPLGVLKWCQEQLNKRSQSLPQPLEDILRENWHPEPPAKAGSVDLNSAAEEEAILKAWAVFGLGLRRGSGDHMPSEERYHPEAEGEWRTAENQTESRGTELRNQTASNAKEEEGGTSRMLKRRSPKKSSTLHEEITEIEPSEAANLGVVEAPTNGRPEGLGLVDKLCSFMEESGLTEPVSKLEHLVGSLSQSAYVKLPLGLIQHGQAVLQEEIRASTEVVMGASWFPAMAIAFPFAVVRFYWRVSCRLLGSVSSMVRQSLSKLLSMGHMHLASGL